MQLVKQLGLAGALAGTLALGGGCSTTTGAMARDEQTWTLSKGASDKVPAATGKVEVAAKPKDGSREVKVKVEHLAKPGEAFDGAVSYVVWIKPQGGMPQNVGTLKVGDDLKGDLKARTPFKVFDVLVTAEPTPQTTMPNLSNEVFSTRVFVAG